jgi:hypothetical protein
MADIFKKKKAPPSIPPAAPAESPSLSEVSTTDVQRRGSVADSVPQAAQVASGSGAPPRRMSRVGSIITPNQALPGSDSKRQASVDSSIVITPSSKSEVGLKTNAITSSDNPVQITQETQASAPPPPISQAKLIESNAVDVDADRSCGLFSVGASSTNTSRQWSFDSLFSKKMSTKAAENLKKLHSACRWGKVNTIFIILRICIANNILGYVVRKLDDVAVQLDTYVGIADWADEKNGNHAVHIAAQNGHLDVVVLLVLHNCDGEMDSVLRTEQIIYFS